ncbi:class F sortase [Agilicoccus flavus]|uniref:class F sortase n=1 Tax=Agilicoccus flavus TaxID=2775968 RepID=UPI001CF6DC89|nr:class F sortase [Agilicoccus flavus]
MTPTRNASPAGTAGAAPATAQARRRRSPGVVGACVVLLVAGTVMLGWAWWPREAPPAPLPTAEFSVGAADPRAEPTGRSPSGAPSEPPAPTRGRPDRLVVESLGIDAPIDVVDLDPAGALVVPGDPGRVGRWAGGADADDDAGTMLLAGHVDADGRLGALHALARAAPRARVLTTDAAGAVTSWRVVALESLDKDDVPEFGRSGPHRLVVVTCGGEVRRTPAAATYEDNVLLTAVPEPRGAPVTTER